MNKIINNTEQILFILLGVSIPTSIAATNIIIGGIVLCWLIEGDFSSKFSRVISLKWTMPMFGLLVLYCCGMFWGDNHNNALWEFQRLALILVFPVFHTINLSQRTIKRAIIAFLFTTTVSALLAIMININIIKPLADYLLYINDSESISAFTQYNYHNILLALSFSLCIYILIERKTKTPTLFVLMIIIYSASIFTEPGRAGQILFNLVAVFYIIYYNRKHLLKLTVSIFLLVFFQIIAYKTSNVYQNRVNHLSQVIINKGVVGNGKDIRYVFFKESLDRILAKPILGYGTGSFGTIFKKEVHSGHHFTIETTPHNQYLYVWFEIGILGLISLLLMFYYQMKQILVMNDGRHRIILPAAFLLIMLVDSYLFIFTLMTTYIFLYTLYSKYQSE